LINAASIVAAPAAMIWDVTAALFSGSPNRSRKDRLVTGSHAATFGICRFNSDFETAPIF
jgi:hypothetical protein